MRNRRKELGLTLIELIVSVVILALTLGGMVNLFGSAKRWIEDSQSRMTMAEVAKNVMGPLQMQVREDQWSVGGNCLSAGACPATTITVQSKLYNVTYTITNDAPIANVNRVETTITWDEQAF